MKTKYVVFETPNGIEDMIIFSGLVQHDWMARGLGLIVSAGFISVHTDFGGDQLIECYGESISLKLNSRPEEDAKIAHRVLEW